MLEPGTGDCAKKELPLSLPVTPGHVVWWEWGRLSLALTARRGCDLRRRRISVSRRPGRIKQDRVSYSALQTVRCGAQTT